MVKSGDPVEQGKQLKYANLVVNTIMLSNVADMTGALASKDGHRVTSDLVAYLSPYKCESAALANNQVAGAIGWRGRFGVRTPMVSSSP